MYGSKRYMKVQIRCSGPYMIMKQIIMCIAALMNLIILVLMPLPSTELGVGWLFLFMHSIFIDLVVQYHWTTDVGAMSAIYY